MQGGTIGISQVLEAMNLEQLSLSYHEMRLMGKEGVSVSGVFCFHAHGFYGWICKEFL